MQKVAIKNINNKLKEERQIEEDEKFFKDNLPKIRNQMLNNLQLKNYKKSEKQYIQRMQDKIQYQEIQLNVFEKNQVNLEGKINILIDNIVKSNQPND